MPVLPDIEIKRAIVHRIIAKEELTEHATLEPTDNLVSLSGEIKEMLVRRMNSALRNDHRTFDLDIERTDAESFFGLVQNLGTLDDNAFIHVSTTLGENLARTQKTSGIPGGFFMLIEASYGEESKPAAIAIKAEPHEALRHTIGDDGKSRLDLLQSVFLSPSQKLFKIGVLFEHEEVLGDEINDIFGCLLYDAQFRVENSPAEYFYKDFLGLTPINNSRIQSKRFFEKTREFAQSIEHREFDHDSFEDALRHELSSTESRSISPAKFAEQYIHDDDVRVAYAQKVVDFMPETFINDPSLVQRQLRTRKIEFENKVSISGPEDEFNHTVKILEQSQDHVVIRISARRKV